MSTNRIASVSADDLEERRVLLTARSTYHALKSEPRLEATGSVVDGGYFVLIARGESAEALIEQLRADTEGGAGG